MPNSLFTHAIGHLCKDWSTGTTQSGTRYANNSMAVNVEKDKPVFINLVAWGKNSENLDKYSGKGSAIYVAGNQSEHEYEGKKSIQITVRDFTFIGSKKKESSLEYGNEEELPF